MNEFEKAQEFGLGKYFEDGKDVRVQLRELFAHAKHAVAREREINLEEVLVRALEDLLEKRDPMQKAERAMKRVAAAATKSVQDKPSVHAATHGHDVAAVPHEVKAKCTRYIPAAVMHAVSVRDRGRCSFRLRESG